MSKKSKKIDFSTNKLYYNIEEVSNHLGVNPSLLRFWEQKISAIQPQKTSTGIRQYRKKDIETLEIVYSLAKVKGMTLDGVEKELNNKKDEYERKKIVIQTLESIREELMQIKDSFSVMKENSLKEKQKYCI